MKKTPFLAVIAAMGLLLAVPLGVQAITYHYIDIEGEVQTIEAGNASEALNVARVNGPTIHSGVKVDAGILDEGDTFANIYHYVDINGNLKSIQAASMDAALFLATDKHPQSGMLLAGIVIDQ